MELQPGVSRTPIRRTSGLYRGPAGAKAGQYAAAQARAFSFVRKPTVGRAGAGAGRRRLLHVISMERACMQALQQAGLVTLRGGFRSPLYT